MLEIKLLNLSTYSMLRSDALILHDIALLYI